MAILNITSRPRKGQNPCNEATAASAAMSQLALNQRPSLKTKSSAVSIRKEGSDENHSASKFHEAMQNPDWRRRDPEGRSSESVHSQPSFLETPGLESRKNSTFRSSRDSSRDHRRGKRTLDCDKMSDSDWEMIPGIQMTEENNTVSELDRVELDYVSNVHMMGMCRVVQHRKLEASKLDGSHSIVQVTPISFAGRGEHSPGTSHEGSSQHVVNIQRVKPSRPKHRVKSDDSLVEQLTAQLEAATMTPPKAQLPPHLYRGYLEGHYPRFYNNMHQFGSQDSDQDVFSTGIRAPQASVDSGIGSSSLETEPGSSRQGSAEQKKSDSNDDNHAYQKLLRKLNVPAQRPKFVTQRDSGYSGGDSGPDAVVEGSGDKSGPRSMGKVDGRRMVTASDFVVGYRPPNSATHQPESSQDSGISSESQRKYNTLNPKAREFLSFASPPPAGNDEATDEQTSAEAISAKVDKDSRPYDSCHTPEDSQAVTIPQFYPSSSLHRDPRTYDTDSLSYAALNGVFSEGLPLVSQDYLRTLSDLYPLSMLPGLEPHPMVHPLVGNLSTQAPASLLSCMNPVAPQRLIAKTPTPMAMPHMIPTGPNSRPPPVPKPRMPDPENQQAYEAYVEWRKANEPGYAMECKLRQQRRSRRALDNRSRSS